MKKIIKAAMLVAFLSFGGWALTTKPSVNQQKDDKGDLKQQVQDSYLQNCARCHGEDGKSESRLGKSLDAADLTSREVQKMSRKKIVRVITDGEDAMPAFDKKLSKKEIAALAKYVRVFKPKK